MHRVPGNGAKRLDVRCFYGSLNLHVVQVTKLNKPHLRAAHPVDAVWASGKLHDRSQGRVALFILLISVILKVGGLSRFPILTN